MQQERVVFLVFAHRKFDHSLMRIPSDRGHKEAGNKGRKEKRVMQRGGV